MKIPETAVLKKYGIWGVGALAIYLLLTRSGRNVTRSAFVGIYGPPETAGPGHVRLAGPKLGDELPIRTKGNKS